MGERKVKYCDRCEKDTDSINELGPYEIQVPWPVEEREVEITVDVTSYHGGKRGKYCDECCDFIEKAIFTGPIYRKNERSKTGAPAASEVDIPARIIQANPRQVFTAALLWAIAAYLWWPIIERIFG